MHNDNSISLCIYQLINKVYLYLVPFVLKHVVKLDKGKQGINIDTRNKVQQMTHVVNYHILT